MDDPSVTQLVILVILLLLSSFFSSAETALTTVNKLRMRSLAEEGKKGADIVCKLIEDPSKMLSAILIGNNIVNLTASSLTTTLATGLAAQGGLPMDASTMVGIATGILTLLILIFGEITPKSLATIYAESLSLKYAKIIYFLTQILTPVIFVVNKISLGILLIFRIDPNKKAQAITENELRTILDVSHEEGVIESEEREMIANVVDFGDSIAKDVMVPRIDVEGIRINSTYDEVVEAFSKEKYSRMPVYNETLDDVVGIINLKDVFFSTGQKEEFKINDIMREPYFTYEFKHTSELLIEMRRDSIPMAIVLDEYGATVGLITLEDLLEEIVGEIRDEYDQDEEDDIQALGNNKYLVNGNTKIDDINDFFDLSLESEDFDSISGHIINMFDRFPDQGETVEDEFLTYTIAEADKNRIDKILISTKPKQEDDLED